ncbi:hypothetical protein CK203_050061 [Vitis vinifera]|uniref:Uncharacterized protein n=1 Tax=Vitis vinifera TaxID=29760 RepID=A0A438H4I3_VITVI|nr:hypothetical protein CK203_050061 [Vitis vinifera]
MDIDYAIRKDNPTIIDTNTIAEKALYEQWEQSNRLSLMFIKTKISDGIRGSISTCPHLDNEVFILKAHQGEWCARAHNADEDIATQLKTLEVEMFDSFLVHFILNTFPQQYGPFKISYNKHKNKWPISELLTMCVQEKGRLKMELGKSALMKMEGKDHNQAKNKKKGKIPPQGGIKKANKCFFCKKKGHMEKGYTKFQKWLEKKGYAKPKEVNAK